jgi:hypothetical protein
MLMGPSGRLVDEKKPDACEGSLFYAEAGVPIA